MKKMNSQKISSKSTGTKEKNGDNYYTIPNEVAVRLNSPMDAFSAMMFDQEARADPFLFRF